MSTLAHDTTIAAATRRLAPLPLAFSISLLFVISYVLYLVWGDGGLHQPWLQFHGWYIALAFVALFDLFDARFG